MNFFFLLGIVAIILTVINGLFLIIGLIRKRIYLIEAFVIVFLAVIGPYGLALISRNFGTDNNGTGIALITWMTSGFILMVATSFYLNHRMKNGN